jgi:hypothetical protein
MRFSSSSASDLIEETLEARLDALTDCGFEPHAVGAGLDALARLLSEPSLRHQVRRDRLTHADERFHLHCDRGRLAEVARNTVGAVALEEHALTRKRRQRHHDVDLAARTSRC